MSLERLLGQALPPQRAQRASEDIIEGVFSIEAEFSEIATRESKPGGGVGRSRSEK
jgi:hypothetical protein